MQGSDIPQVHSDQVKEHRGQQDQLPTRGGESQRAESSEVWKLFKERGAIVGNRHDVRGR